MAKLNKTEWIILYQNNFAVAIYLKQITLTKTVREKLVTMTTVKILKFGTPQTIAIIVLKLVKFDVTLH